MEAQAKMVIAVTLLVYVVIMYLAIRWWRGSNNEMIEDDESQWMLDDFYLPKDM